MEQLINPIRPYAWGSRTVIAELLGESVPSPHPQAEMWLGAHPQDPSSLAGPGGRCSLLDVLRADPDGQLGPLRVHRWSGTLPYLLKVLAADEPLSLQAHPSLEQAGEGFDREDAAGLPRDAVDRNYRDANHKPELICALTPMNALVGFRDPVGTVRLLHALAVPELEPHAQLLAAEPNAGGLRALFTTWITLPQSVLDRLVPALAAGAARLAENPDDTSGAGEFGAVAGTVLDLARRYPGDAGVLAAVLLNRVTLAPGEAVFLPAGNLHAYLSGAGVELMANSDNVLRGGLTPKHVDVPELLRVLDFTFGPPPIDRGRPDGAGWLCYDTPIEEFLLRRWEAPDGGSGSGPVAVPDGGPRIMLCTAGKAVLRGSAGDLEIGRGQAAWLAAGDLSVTVHDAAGGTQLFLAGDALG